MILDRDLVSSDDFNDCHDEIVVAGVDFIGRQLICGHYLQWEGVHLGTTNEDNYSGHRSHRRWSQRENQGLEVTNLHPMFYWMKQLSIFFHRLRCVLDWFQNIGSCGMSNVLGLVVGFNTTLFI